MKETGRAERERKKKGMTRRYLSFLDLQLKCLAGRVGPDGNKELWSFCFMIKFHRL